MGRLAQMHNATQALTKCYYKVTSLVVENIYGDRQHPKILLCCSRVILILPVDEHYNPPQPRMRKLQGEDSYDLHVAGSSDQKTRDCLN